jgi:D-lyxose ketol-isomerase
MRGNVKDMKRSEINKAIRAAEDALEAISFKLPPFSTWDKKEWESHTEDINTFRELMLGWDVTDFGSGDFSTVGAVLFTLRNGNLYNTEAGVPYCEKIIVFNDQEKQVIPFHFHNNKSEDIINRGNGIMEIELYNSRPGGKVDKETEVTVLINSVKTTVSAGEVVELQPGESITLTPGLYHRFGVKKGAGALVCGEVSKINDDNTDNVFAEEQKRFSDIIEDEAPIYPLCNEY